MAAEKFWTQDFSVLLRPQIIPMPQMSYVEKLNALTRLIVIITIVLFIGGYKNYLTIFIAGIVLIIILFAAHKKESFIQPNKPTDECGYNPSTGLINAAYEITPRIQFNHFDDAKRSYMNAKYEQMPLYDTEGFKEIWRAEPEMQGSFTMIPDPETVFPAIQDVEEPLGQQNYIVRSKIDHLAVAQAQTDLYAVRPIAEQDYTESTLNFRAGLLNEHIDRFVRERKHNCPDAKLYSGNAGAGGSI